MVQGFGLGVWGFRALGSGFETWFHLILEPVSPKSQEPMNLQGADDPKQ